MFISPAKGHSLHRVADVPADIAANMNPDEFHKQMMNHFKNHSKKTTLVDPSEHRTYWLRHGLAVPKK